MGEGGGSPGSKDDGAIGAAAAMGQVDWKYVASAAVLAGVLSVLTSVAGIPEVEGE